MKIQMLSSPEQLSRIVPFEGCTMVISHDKGTHAYDTSYRYRYHDHSSRVVVQKAQASSPNIMIVTSAGINVVINRNSYGEFMVLHNDSSLAGKLLNKNTMPTVSFNHDHSKMNIESYCLQGFKIFALIVPYVYPPKNIELLVAYELINPHSEQPFLKEIMRLDIEETCRYPTMPKV